MSSTQGYMQNQPKGDGQNFITGKYNLDKKIFPKSKKSTTKQPAVKTY